MTKAISIGIDLQRPAFELNVKLTLPSEGISVLFGPSGSGKTTILRCVAGLESTFNGHIAFGDQTWFDSDQGINLAVWRRSIGYVFQEASLFEHLTVQQNLQYGLKRVKGSSQAVHDLSTCIDLLGIGDLLKRQPTSLSGGQRQRVAIARALATQPQLLLLDEPLAALDQDRRQEIMPWLERLRDELKTPMLYVTHSHQEAARLGDHMVLLSNGDIQQTGPVNQMMAHLQDQDIGALLTAQVTEIDKQWQLAEICFEGTTLVIADRHLSIGQDVRVRIDARDVSLTTSEPVNTSIQNVLRTRIVSIQDGHEPSHALVTLACDQTMFYALVTHKAVQHLALAVEQVVWAQIKSVALLS